MSIRIEWHGEELKQAVDEASLEGLTRASVYFHDLCRRAVNRSNPRNRRSGQYDQPSKPGEPPKARTGFGRDNIVWGTNDDPKHPVARVGITANAMYMYWLEIGFTRKSVTITAKPGRKLKIPWSGPEPTEEQIKHVGLKRIDGGWFYFRRQVTLRDRGCCRPWRKIRNESE
jgi:hypothetical protein